MKLYRLYLAKPLLVFYLVMFTAWILAGVVGTIVGMLGKLGPGGPPVFLFVIWAGAASLFSYFWLRIPFEIRICDDTSIKFRSLLRTTIISPAEIQSVRAKPYELGFVDVVHQRGTVHLISQMDGFHDFISTIKSMNPMIKVEGC
jgi:hypothetical protein